ncbi:hypothetical protein BaRGS_00026721 [Batillaria attramentaria]|uniref:GH18 domain-containing protein n=1 Tax=Batillaria attramentaria TaxID=370345 RepID=A0ABD0K439_9CAEN
MAPTVITLLVMSWVTCMTSAQEEGQNYRTVCYVEGWTHWRSDPYKFETSDIDTSLCTHVVWNHAELDSTGLNITVHDNGDEEM